MKTDLATAIGAAVLGLLIAYFATNFFMGPIEDVTYKTIDANVSTSLIDPDPEIFNYRALNPTVEVYIGSCIEYDSNGECLEILEEEEINESNNESKPEENQENF